MWGRSAASAASAWLSCRRRSGPETRTFRPRRCRELRLSSARYGRGRQNPIEKSLVRLSVRIADIPPYYRPVSYLIATAVLGVGAPVTLIAVIATVSSNTVCVSLVPKYLIPVVPAPTGAAAEKYRGERVCRAIAGGGRHRRPDSRVVECCSRSSRSESQRPGRD